MVRGLDQFQQHFADLSEHYVPIGGVACDRLFYQAGPPFRATKDLDIVLCVEALDSAFVQHFWQFVTEGGYQHREKSSGDKQYYRFVDPADERYPVMLELFGRTPDGVSLEGHGHLTPIPIGQDVDSLSAILLDDDYYACIQRGKHEVDGLILLGAEYLLPFKARAWLDLSERKARGDKVDSKDIKKHRSDVFRLYQLLAPDQKIELPGSIRKDLAQFVAAVSKDDLDMKNYGLRNQSLSDVLDQIGAIYQLELEQ